MPIERRSSRSQITVVIVALCTVVLVGSLVYAVVKAAGGGKAVAFNLGDDKFRPGNAKVLARQAATAPILLSDVSGNGQKRPVVLTHHGKDAATGWVVFDARPPGAPRDCILQVDRTDGRLVFPPADRARCGSDTYDASGAGVTTYTWTVGTDGELVIDLRKGSSATTSTTR